MKCNVSQLNEGPQRCISHSGSGLQLTPGRTRRAILVLLLVWIALVVVMEGGAMSDEIRKDCRVTGWVDRIESGIAVICPEESEQEIRVRASCFDPPVSEGDFVREGVVDPERRRESKEAIDGLLDDLVVSDASDFGVVDESDEDD